MVDYNNIEELVRGNLIFFTESNNWHRIYCEVCGDGRRTKGPRGGWIFEGDYCAYHCFNCGIDGNFDPTREFPWSRTMRDIFEAFGIPDLEITKLVAAAKKKNTTETVPKRVVNPINPIAVPDHFYRLRYADPDDLMAIKADAYLKGRCIDPDSYPFYLSTGISYSNNPKEKYFAKAMFNRVIIPSFRNGEMVYYTGRFMDEGHKLPYLNAPIPKSNIIFGFDRLYSPPKNILFVLEGFFDAHLVNGVAVLENHMTAAQIDILEKSPRRKVIIPDRKGDSRRLAEQGLELGWEISIPEIGDCKDVSKAVEKYGKLYVLDSIMKNIKAGRQAEFSLKFL